MVAISLDLLIIHSPLVLSHKCTVLLSFLLKPNLGLELISILLLLFLFLCNFLLILDCFFGAPLLDQVSIGFLLNLAQLGLVLMLSHLVFEGQNLVFLQFCCLDVLA